MRRILYLLVFCALVSLWANQILAAELPECDYTGNPTRPGGECETRVPYVQKNLEDYSVGLTCSVNPEIIPDVSSCDYTPAIYEPEIAWDHPDERKINGYADVSYFTELKNLGLGGWGPSTQSYAANNPDSLAKVYPFNALADKPLETEDIPREAYRTYWRLSTLHEQISAKAQFFKRYKSQNPPIFDSKFPYVDPTNEDKSKESEDLKNPPYPANTGPNIGYGHIFSGFGDMAEGKPVTFLVSLNSSAADLQKFAELYSRATYRIVRVLDLTPTTSADTIANSGRSIGTVFNRPTDITVFGNELNAETEYNCGNDLKACGANYAPQFINFYNAVKSTGSPIKVGTAPMNAGHPIRSAKDFLIGAAAAYQKADLTVHNVYQVTPAVCANSGLEPIRCSLESWSWEQQITGTTGKTHIYTEYNLMPFEGDTDLVAVLKFITSGPSHPLVITSLIRNPCTAGTSGQWLIYDGKNVKDSLGKTINPTSCKIDYPSFKISELISKLPDCLKTFPLPNRCGLFSVLGDAPENAYQKLSEQTKAMYDAFLPFDFDNLRGYLALNYTSKEQQTRVGVLAENVPYIQAINDLLTKSTFSVLSAISPDWINTSRSQLSTEIIPKTVLNATQPVDEFLTKESVINYYSLGSAATKTWKQDALTTPNGCFKFDPKGPSLPAPSTFPQKLPHQSLPADNPLLNPFILDTGIDSNTGTTNSGSDTSLLQTLLVPATLTQKHGVFSLDESGKGRCSNGCSPRIDGFCPDQNTLHYNVEPHPDQLRHPNPDELDTRTKDTAGRAIAVFNNPVQTEISNNIAAGDKSLTGMLMPQGLITPTPNVPILADTAQFNTNHPDYKVYVSGEEKSSGQVARVGGLAEVALCKLRNFWLRPFGLQSGTASDCEKPDEFINTVGLNDTSTNLNNTSCQSFSGKNTSPFGTPDVQVVAHPVVFSQNAKQSFIDAANCFGISPKIIAAISAVEVGNVYSNNFDRSTEAYCAPSGDGCGSWGPFQFLHNDPQGDNGDSTHPSCYGFSDQGNTCPAASAASIDVWADVGSAFNECNSASGPTNICSMTDSIYAVAKQIANNSAGVNWNTDAAYDSAIKHWNSGACAADKNYLRLGNLNYCQFAVWFNQHYDSNLNYHN